MPRSLLAATNSLVVLLTVCCLTAPIATLAADEAGILPATEKQLQELYDRVSPAVVRFARHEDGTLGTRTPGVIVSQDGLIATMPNWVLWDSRKEHRPIFCFLADGRTAKCTLLGWSQEWQIALVKLDDPGPWPCVEIEDKAEVSAGQPYAALLYSLQPDTRHFEERPQIRIGSILHCSSPIWFTTSSVDGFAPIFSLNGHLIGITTDIPVRNEAACTSSALLAKYWKALADGKNLDRELLDKPANGGFSSRPKPGNNDAHADEPATKAAIEHAASATVRIRSAGSKNGWSGVIVSADGFIATCAHHFELPGEPVTIELSDGHNAAGKIMGMDRIADVGLVKITDKGPWPHVEMSDSVSAVANDPCSLIGFPASHKDRMPLIRQSSIVEPDEEPWSHVFYTSKSVKLFGGDSGGGAFDSHGRLIGSFEGQNPDNTGRYHRVELFRQQWDYFAAGKPVDAISGPPLGEFVDAFSQITKRLPNFAVEVLGDEKPRVWGTIVGQDGKILTKASELYGAISVRLPNGKTLPATLKKYSRPHDLALLKIDASDLAVAAWSDTAKQLPGKLVAALVPDGKPRVGIVSCKVRGIPVDRGSGLVVLQDTKNGLEVVDDAPARKSVMLIRKGDIILRVEGHETPDSKAELALLGDGWNAGNLIMNAGDPLIVTVKRGEKTIDLRFPRPPVEGPRPQTESHRYAGFPEVFDVDLSLKMEQCGGPIVDNQGHVVGITIAALGDDWHQTHMHVLPAKVVQAFITEK